MLLCDYDFGTLGKEARVHTYHIKLICKSHDLQELAFNWESWWTRVSVAVSY